MVRQSVRIALLVGTVAAMASAPARASDHHGSSGCCSPSTRTICVTECVPETYTVKRITYKQEQRIEKYTAYKCETVQEVREKVCTVYKQVPEWREECRNVCVTVPVCEERTVMKPHYSYVTETKYITKCVDRGHWECREEYSCLKAMCNHFMSLCQRHDDCCNPCPPSNCVTRKCWVPCMVQEQCPVTCCRKVCEMRPECIKVQTCKTEIRQEKVKVCVMRCVPEQVCTKYTVCVNRMVPYEATRCVTVCVPCEELVTCTRMVARQVTREVPCCQTTTCCQPTCCPTSCCNLFSGCSLSGLFSGCRDLFSGCNLFGGHGCNSGCNTGCDTGCGSGCGGLFSGCNLGGLFSGCSGLFGGCGSRGCNGGCN